PGVRRILVNNPGPFTYTGTWTYVVGEGEVAVIDPGPVDEAHLDALLAGLGSETVSHILITHTHLDHSPGAAPLKALTGAPTLGFGPHGAGKAAQGVRVEEGGDMAFQPDIVLADGAQIEGKGWSLEAVYTPGHTSNHLAFAWGLEKALFCGDVVMGWSTAVISPPDGDMGDYFQSLERLAAREDRVFYPTHGPAIPNPQPFVRAYIDHRRERERQVLDQLSDTPQSISALVATIYAAVDPRLHPAAALSVRAHLDLLEQNGQVVGTDGAGGERLYTRSPS
ncbi:MAG: MBL fold metallo-hydrolase, partial [Pseudomonadota bacterium]